MITTCWNEYYLTFILMRYTDWQEYRDTPSIDDWLDETTMVSIANSTRSIKRQEKLHEGWVEYYSTASRVRTGVTHDSWGSMRKLNNTILQLWWCCHVMYNLLYPSIRPIRVRTAPSVSVRVSVSFSFGVTPLRILICMCPDSWINIRFCLAWLWKTDWTHNLHMCAC